MKHYPWILFSGGLLALAFAPGACGGSSSNGAGGSGGTPATTTTTTTTTSTTSSTGVTTSSGSSSSSGANPVAVCDAPDTSPSNGSCWMPLQPPACPHPGQDGGTGTTTDCSGFIASPAPCGTCIMGACCDELAACKANTACWACFNDQTGMDPGCSDTTAMGLLQTISACANGCCSDTCFDAGCNPITNDGCDAAAGEACDLSNSGFVCFPDGNTESQCASCDNNNGPFCMPGLHCNADSDGNTGCTHYCCDDGDCGANGKCDKTVLGDPNNPNIGLCPPK